MQTSIFDHIPPKTGVYVCLSDWVNEMGYKWKPGEKILVRAIHGGYSDCFIPGQKQIFHLSNDTIVKYFNPLITD